MAFSLSTFRRRVHSVGRNQYFAIRIPQIGDEEIVTAMARSTTLPAKTHESQNVPYRGLNMQVVNRPTFEPWNVTFLCDEAHVFRNILKKWMEKSYNVQQLRNESHNDYKRDGVSVSQLSSDLQITSTSIFYGLYPSSVAAVELNQEGGQIETFQCTFTYDYYVDNDLQGDVVFNDIDVDVNDDGRFSGVSIEGIAGVNLNF